MAYKPIVLDRRYTGKEDNHDLALKVNDNIGEVEFYLNQIQKYENVTGMPLNVIVNDNNASWTTAFNGTINYRSAGAPTNNPTPSGITVTTNTNATINIKLDWAAYTQGAKQADLLMLFWKKGDGAPTVNDSTVSFNVNTASASYYILEGVNPADTYSFGLASARRTENGIEIGTIQSPTTAPDWQGVTSGTPNYTGNINGTTAATVTTVATNFNGRNDRLATVPANPTILADGTAVDHTINTDGSADISLEWGHTGTGDAYNIDGFFFYMRASTSATAYTFGTTPSEETIYYMSYEKRAIIISSVAADKYYTLGVQAYRHVDQDINATGILKSSIIQPSLAAENPYRPSANVAFAGDITNTINGMPVATVTSTTDLVNNVVANERLGAQVVGFKAGSVRYKIDGTQVLSNLPRYETGRFGQAVMMEEGSQNTLLYSDQFDNAAWLQGNTPVITPNSTVAPDGTTTADTIQDDNAAAYESVYQSSTCANSETWTGSVYIKKDTNTTRYPEIQLDFLGGTTNIFNPVQINTQTGATIIRAGFGTPIVEVKSVGDYWRLCITGTNNATGNNIVRLYIYPAITTTWGSAEVAATGSCIVWRAQLEKKAYATSGIQTTSAAVTRVAETMVVPVSGNFAKNNWTVEITYNPSIVGMTRYLWYCYIDASNWYRIIATSAGQFQISVCSGGTEVGFTTALNPIITVGTNYSIMFAGNGSVIRACVNGVQIGADTAYTEPAGTLPTFMYLGSDQAGTGQANGLMDDTRFSSTARTAASHATAYAAGVPLVVDEYTSLKQDFDGTLRQTTRNHVSRPTGSFMIADNDTTQDKSRATHIIPSGWTSAQIVFNQAISELPTTGGSINGMDGIPIVDNSIILPSNVTMDLGTMTLKVKDGIASSLSVITNSDITNGNINIKIKNGILDGNKTNKISGTQTGIYLVRTTNYEIQGVTPKNFSGDGILVYTYCADATITRNICTNNDVGGIRMQNLCRGNKITENICTYNGGYGISGYTNCYSNTISGNTCNNNTAEGILLVSYSDKNAVNNNICQNNLTYGIYSSISSHNNITGNSCISNLKDGILLYDQSHDNNVIGNIVNENSQLTDAVYSNITIDTNCDRNSIQSNICRRGSGVKQPAYGIKIANSTCDTNVITNNDLITGGKTASLLDAGTGTVTAAGNRI